MYIDGCRSGDGAEAEAARGGAVLRARRLSRRRANSGRADGCDREGARRPDPDSAGRRAPKARGQGVCLRARAALRSLAADRLPPPQGAARGRHRRLRAAGTVGLLLRQPRGTGGIERMAEQLTDKDEIREAVRERYAAAATSVGEGRVACCTPSTGSEG